MNCVLCKDDVGPNKSLGGGYLCRKAHWQCQKCTTSFTGICSICWKKTYFVKMTAVSKENVAKERAKKMPFEPKKLGNSEHKQDGNGVQSTNDFELPSTSYIPPMSSSDYAKCSRSVATNREPVTMPRDKISINDNTKIKIRDQRLNDSRSESAEQCPVRWNKCETFYERNHFTITPEKCGTTSVEVSKYEREGKTNHRTESVDKEFILKINHFMSPVSDVSEYSMGDVVQQTSQLPVNNARENHFTLKTAYDCKRKIVGCNGIDFKVKEAVLGTSSAQHKHIPKSYGNILDEVSCLNASADIIDVVSLEISYPPVKCPDKSRARTVFVSDLSEHLTMEHRDQQQIFVGQQNDALVDIQKCRIGKVTCNAIRLVVDRTKGLGVGKFGRLLPLFILSTRLPLTEICRLQKLHGCGQEGDNNEKETDLLMIWVASVIPVHTSMKIPISLAAYGPKLSVAITVPSYPIRKPISVSDVLENGDVLLLSRSQIEAMTGNACWQGILKLRLLVP